MTTVGAACFARRRPVAAERRPIDAGALPPATALALAETLPFLLCGEESAVHAFGRHVQASAEAADQAALGGIAAEQAAFGGIAAEQAALGAIAADEQRHADWLEALTDALPAPAAAPDAASMAAFFRRLLTRDPALHFARIAALDLAVCAILRPLAAPRGALATAPQVIAGLAAIRRDEARHVRVARRCAGALGFAPTEQRAVDLATRTELAALLAPVKASLAALGFEGFDHPRARHAG